MVGGGYFHLGQYKLLGNRLLFGRWVMFQELSKHARFSDLVEACAIGANQGIDAVFDDNTIGHWANLVARNEIESYLANYNTAHGILNTKMRVPWSDEVLQAFSLAAELNPHAFEGRVMNIGPIVPTFGNIIHCVDKVRADPEFVL